MSVAAVLSICLQEITPDMHGLLIADDIPAGAWLKPRRYNMYACVCYAVVISCLQEITIYMRGFSIADDMAS